MPRGRQLERGEVLALLLSLVFTAAAVFLLVVGDADTRRKAIGVLALFGASVLVWIGVWWRRRGEARNRDARSVSIVGGVPLRVRPGRLIALGAGLVAVGLAYGWGLGGQGTLGGILGGIQVASGLAVLAVVVWRWRARGLQFEPDALHVVDAGIAFALPWEELAEVTPLEFHSNAFIALRLADVDRAIARAGARRRNGADATEALRRVIARNQRWVGADLWIHPGLYGLDAVLLTAALRRYAQDPAARAELARRPLPAAAA